MPHELDTLAHTYLLDEFEQRLKSQNDYRSALLHVAQTVPEVRELPEAQVTPIFGDWPTWYYTKKLVAQVSPTKQNTRVNTELAYLWSIINYRPYVMTAELKSV